VEEIWSLASQALQQAPHGDIVSPRQLQEATLPLCSPGPPPAPLLALTPALIPTLALPVNGRSCPFCRWKGRQPGEACEALGESGGCAVSLRRRRCYWELGVTEKEEATSSDALQLFVFPFSLVRRAGRQLSVKSSFP